MDKYNEYKIQCKMLIKIIMKLVKKHRINQDDNILLLINNYNHILRKIITLMKIYIE